MVPCTEVTGSNSFFFYNVLAEIFSIKRKSLKLEVPLEIVGTKNTPLSFPLHQDYYTMKSFPKNRDTSENKASL